MIRELDISLNHTTVDFGCGIGRYSLPLSQAVGANGAFTAIERSEDEIQEFKKRLSCFPTHAPIELVHSDEFHLTFIKDNTIDAVLAFDVLQYIDNWETFFTAVKRILRPHGTFHIYPAAIPHPNVVDLEHLDKTLLQTGFRRHTKKRFTMMHNKDMVTDTVHSYRIQDDHKSQ